MDAGTGAAVSGIVGGTVGLIGNILNYVSQEHTNQANAAINQQNLDYNKAMTEASWARDDNAHQREVADLEAAGLSPLASMQGAGVSSPLGAPSPIAMQAPQIDTNALINSVLGSAKLAEEHRHNRQNEQFKETELDIQAEKNKLMADEIDLGNRELNEKIRYQTNLNKLAADNLAEVIRSNQKSEQLRLSEVEAKEFANETEDIARRAKEAAGGKNIRVEFTSDFNKYKNALQARIDAEKTMLEEIAKVKTRQAKASGSTESANAGVGVTGMVSGSAGMSSGSNNYYSEDNSKSIDFIIDSFNQNYPIYIFVAPGEYKHHSFN